MTSPRQTGERAPQAARAETRPTAGGTASDPMRLPVPVPRPGARQGAFVDDMPVEPEFAFADRYPAGTRLAVAAHWVGWSGMGAGAALAAAGILGLAPGLASPSLLGLPAGIVYGLGMAVSGLALVFVGQLALAVFDNANASRQLMAIERAKADL